MIRRTKIVATMGPSIQDPDTLKQLLAAGVDVVRLNCSHSRHDEMRTRIERIRKVAEGVDKPVAILLDLQGPKIRTGALDGGNPVFLETGTNLIITTDDVPGTVSHLSTTYKALPDDVSAGDEILLSDGMIELKVLRVHDGDVECLVTHGGMLKEHQGINLPGVALSTPTLTGKDRADLEAGLAAGVDYVALSFVRRPEDIIELKQLIQSLGHDTPVIAKIEKPEAVAQLEKIVLVADGLMVARGDLGVEMPTEDVPVIQKKIISLANLHGVPVITATQMLDSMIHHPRPTRAEASDVANAIFDGSDAVMLSGETAIGTFPIETVKVMARIAEETEDHLFGAQAEEEPLWRKTPRKYVPDQESSRMTHALADAACAAADDLDAAGIVPFTISGRTALCISQRRPRVPIYALTPNEGTCRRTALWWGVRAFLFPQFTATDEMIEQGEEVLLERKVARVGDVMVCIAGASTNTPGGTNLMKIHHFDGKNPYRNDKA